MADSAGGGRSLSMQVELVRQLTVCQAANITLSGTIEAMAAKIKSLEGEMYALHLSQDRRAVSESRLTTAPSTSPQEDEVAAASLLGPLGLLPTEVLELVVSKVHDKASLRSTCRSLRLGVNGCTSKLHWAGPSNVVGSIGGGAALPLMMTLQLSLPAHPMALRLLDCSGVPGKLLRIHSLEGCPLTLRSVVCSYTLVAGLGPLAACGSLTLLNCSHTEVVELGPLAACPALEVLDCSDTRVEELGPLADCRALHSLNCSTNSLSELGPLAACTMLHTLNCSNTGVTGLGPLAVCAALQTLNCRLTKVVDLGPLAACTALRNLNCSLAEVSDLAALAACTSLQTLNCSHNQLTNLGPLAACTALQVLDCSDTEVVNLGPLAACTGLQTLSLWDTGITDIAPLLACTALIDLRCSPNMPEFHLLLLQGVCHGLTEVCQH